MNKLNYSEKLKDPRWQKKRLEILERDNWTCRGCGGKETTLHVHHIAYLSGIEPWDIPDGFLITLCKTCHKRSCEAGPCESCRDYLVNCDGPGSVPADLVRNIGIVLDLIWKKKGDFLDVLYEAHEALRPDSEL